MNTALSTIGHERHVAMIATARKLTKAEIRARQAAGGRRAAANMTPAQRKARSDRANAAKAKAESLPDRIISLTEQYCSREVQETVLDIILTMVKNLNRAVAEPKSPSEHLVE